MTEKELKRLTRADLLEMLIAQSEELRQVKERLKTAEASLRLNGVFEAAQAACEQYTENIRLLSERSQLVCRRMEEESREQAERLLEQTRRRCEEMEAQANAAGCEGNWQ